MKIYYILAVIGIVGMFLLPRSVAAQGKSLSNSGSVAAPFLMISLDARGLAMGNAATASAQGIEAAVWNPAAIAVNAHNFFIAHAQWFADIRLDQAGLGFYLNNIGTIGVYLSSVNYGEMDVTTVVRPQGTGERFRASDFSLGAMFARSITDRLTLGMAVKYVQQIIWHSKASTLAFDVGTLFHSPIWGLDFGVSISNVGGDLRMQGRDTRVFYDIDPEMTGNDNRVPARLETESWPLPLLMRAGIQRNFRLGQNHQIATAIEVFYPSDNFESVNAGIEYAIKKMVFLRVGYRGLFLPENPGGLSAGMGVQYRSGRALWSIQYAYSDFGLLHSINVFSLSVNWF